MVARARADSLPALAFVDSHTEGEPTRVIHDGLPIVGGATPRERIDALLRARPSLRADIIDAPRGYPALVGAVLLPPCDPQAAALSMFVNNVGLLPMCVHASIGIARTLVHLGRHVDGPWPAPLRLETLAGDIELQLHDDGRVAVTNVPAYRLRSVELPTRHGMIRGDLAWGGNWFVIVEQPPIAVTPHNLDALMQLALELRAAIDAADLRGDDGAAIDHVQLCGPSDEADSRNFVLCPGREYDRSPCGTGTSARLACLHADGRLRAGQRWRQQGITGSCFDAELEPLAGGRVRPTIHGRALITAEGRLLY